VNQTVYYDGMYAPFGENYGESGSADRSFTGPRQDMTSGLYDFTSRQDCGEMGAIGEAIFHGPGMASL